MFWKPPAPAAGSSSPTTSRSRASTISRSVHLSSYLNHNVLKPSTRKVSSDDTIYDTVFQTTNGFALILRVYLPIDNSRAPSMTLHGVRASHNWLDIRMKVIGYGPISSDQRWKSSNLKLGDAVYAVIHHFQLTPPSIMDITDENLKRLQESISGNRQPAPPNSSSFPSSASSNFQRPDASNQMESVRQEHQPRRNEAVEEKPNFEVADYEVNALMPPIPSSFPEIDSMPLSEVTRLKENKAFLDLFIENTSGVKTLTELKQSIENSNVEAAKANLAHEEKMEDLCTEVETLKQDLNTKVQQYRKLDAERQTITQPPDLQEAIQELNKAKRDAYRESEEMAEDWVESGGEDVSGFVKKFMEIRLLYHTRAAKAERLENLM